MLERLLMKVLEGITLGLQQRYANAATRNLDANAALVAGTNSSARGYVDLRSNAALANGNLGRVLGVNAATYPGAIAISSQPTTARVSTPTAAPRIAAQPAARTAVNLPLGFEVKPLR